MFKIKEVRIKKGLSQQELAEKAGLGQSTIHYIETGAKSPTIKVLEKIAKALEVSMTELLQKDKNTA